ncbi:MAG TPA: TauD/TfdA family dioxygenase [Blastocatellia bacterium]|jgi:alpha-ketoglutarate-dependent taurine dioxygenase|nr:TauD/TfdA family dioxygenase [Blastocatellia bacterium]
MKLTSGKPFGEGLNFRARKTFCATNLIKTGSLQPGQNLPLVIEPNLPGISLSNWAANNHEFIEDGLLSHGAILFRGFNLNTPGEFEDVVKASRQQLLHYVERTSPRKQVSDWVYTSTEFPSDQHIALHNEMSYASSWPMKIWFFCSRPADSGGETPIADVRKVFNRISPEIRGRFAEKRWMLVRNFSRGLGLTWQTSFCTDERAEVEEYCRRSDIDFQWRDENRLRTSQVRSAIAKHPRTDEHCWFNHVAFYHVSSLNPELRPSLLSAFGEDGLPFNTYYGDGSPIEDDVIAQIRQAYREETIEFPWRRGDVLLADNMLVCHGRKPFSGPRETMVAMCEPSGGGAV